MNDTLQFKFIPDFTEYGNRPKVIAIAWNVRVEIQRTASLKKSQMKRSKDTNGVVRLSKRIDVFADDAWHHIGRLIKARGWWLRPAPRSPAAHWLAAREYEQFPF